MIFIYDLNLKYSLLKKFVFHFMTHLINLFRVTMPISLSQDSNVTWNTPSPDLTPCFQRTVLPWIPCVLLLVLSPLRLYGLSSQKSSKNAPDSNHSWLSLTKYVSIPPCLFLRSLILHVNASCITL